MVATAVSESRYVTTLYLQTDQDPDQDVLILNTYDTQRLSCNKCELTVISELAYPLGYKVSGSTVSTRATNSPDTLAFCHYDQDRKMHVGIWQDNRLLITDFAEDDVGTGGCIDVQVKRMLSS